MHRHSQNISFVAIIAMIMSCAFFFSQKNNTTPDEEASTKDALINVSQIDSVADLPDCSSDVTSEDQAECLSQAVEASQSFLDLQLDAILDLTADSDLRIKFVESQINWEDSRDADCDLVRGLENDTDKKDIDELTCLRDANLQRLDYLNLLYCDLNPEAVCPSEDLPKLSPSP